MKLNEVFVQGSRKYVVIGFDGQNRPIATCDAAAVAAAAKADRQTTEEAKPKKKTKT